MASHQDTHSQNKKVIFSVYNCFKLLAGDKNKPRLFFRQTREVTAEVYKNSHFKYKKCNDERKFLIVRIDIVSSRVRFLRKMNAFRSLLIRIYYNINT